MIRQKSKRLSFIQKGDKGGKTTTRISNSSTVNNVKSIDFEDKSRSNIEDKETTLSKIVNKIQTNINE